MRSSLGWECTTPCAVNIKRRSAFSIDVELHGYQTARVLIKPELDSTGALALSGNVLLGGLIGAAVDSVGGSAYRHAQNPLIVRLVEITDP